MKTYRKLFGTAHVTLKKSLVKGAITAALLFIGVLTVDADSVYIPNASFDFSGPAQTSTNPDIANEWVFNVQGGSTYGISNISSKFSSSGTATGGNYAFINNDYPGVTDTITTAASLGEITADTTYTLTVALGNPNGTGLYDNTGDVYFGLTANGSQFVIDPILNGSISNGTFQDFSFSFTTPVDAAYAGESLGIVLASLPESNNAFQPSFDNVRLDETDLAVAPEPTSFVLILGGLALLGCVQLRRRRPTLVSAGLVAIVFSAIGSNSASAAPVNVPNASFETNPWTGWSYNDPTILPGWIFNAPAGSGYGSLLMTATFTSPDLSSGNDFAFIDNNAPGVEGFLTSAASLGTITADTTYTLTVALGSPDAASQGGPFDFDPVAGVAPAEASLELLANGQPFAIDTLPAGSVASGSWQDFSFSYTTTDFDPVVGQQLTIQLGTKSDFGAPEEVSFDTIRLDASDTGDASDIGDPNGSGDGSGNDVGTTPEPSTWGLLGIGLAALGSLTRGQRSRRDSLL
jgi:hypothetical protein